MAKKRKSKPQGPTPAEAAEAALERFRPLLEAEELAQLLDELERPLPPSIRINPLKVEPEAALAGWRARYGWEVQPVPYCPNGWWITESRTAPSQTIEHRLGEYYIQDAASMLPVELFDFDDLDAPLTLDLAASPGGKTTHITARTGDRGLVIANNSSASRITALRLVLDQWGATNAAVTRFPGESFGAWFPETFDRALLDAPCSMQGLRTSESHPMRAVSEKETASLAQRQERLLESALQAVKVGGQVVYSTCTLAPEEDEAVLDALLQRYPGAFEIVELEGKLPQPAPALAKFGEQDFDPSVPRAARLWPHRYGTSGFFAALLRKTGPFTQPSAGESGQAPGLPGGAQEAPSRPMSRSGFEELSEQEAQAWSDGLMQAYAFDLAETLERSRLALWRRGREVYAIPRLYLERFRELPVQSLGLPLGEELPDSLAPSHEWVARFSGEFLTGRYPLEEEHLRAWLRGEDIRSKPLPGYPTGMVVIVEDASGRLLGRGRVLRDRLKNLLPRRSVL